jgi:acyl carrier protein
MKQFTKGQIYEQVTSTLVEMFEVDAATITSETRLYEDLDLDSIDAIDMAVKMQEITGERFDEQALRKIRTVGDIVTQIEATLLRHK